MTTQLSHDALIEDVSSVFQVKAVERRNSLSRQEFMTSYHTGLGEPVVITDATNDWPARHKWTFDFFRERYGSETITVQDRVARPTVSYRVKFSEYLTYCEYPFATSLASLPSPHPLYAARYSPISRCPELAADYSEPYFVENCYKLLQGDLRSWYLDTFGWLFIGPRGTVAPIHVDLFATHAWLAQLVGRKRFLLFSPADAKYLYNGEADLQTPDAERFPLLRNATARVAVLEPGEVIFIPAGWMHDVKSLDPSISLTYNFVNETNYVPHVLAICRDLPEWVRRTDSAALRRMLGIQWKCKGFDQPNTVERPS